MTEEHLNQIREKTLSENALSLHTLCEYKNQDEYLQHKWLYRINKEEFVRKFKLKFPAADDDEIKNFTRIYLVPGDFIMDIDGDDFRISRIIFIGNYLKEFYVDHNYRWFLENTNLGLRFP